METKVKQNTIIESLTKGTVYKSLIDYLEKNLSKLPDFVLSEKEIGKYCSNFDYDSFLKEFNATEHFERFQFLRSPHDPQIFHIVFKGTKIPSKYTKDVMRVVAEKGYDTSNIETIVNYWNGIYKKIEENLSQAESGGKICKRK